MSAVVLTHSKCWQVSRLQVCFHAAGHPRGGGRYVGERVSSVSWVTTLTPTPSLDSREFLLCDHCIWFGVEIETLGV